MTIQDLIDKLQQFDPALKVVLTGYEGGCYFLYNARQVNIALDVNTDWYYGPHEVIPENDEYMQQQTKDFAKQTAILLI